MSIEERSLSNSEAIPEPYFKVTQSIHGMPSLEVQNPSPGIARLIRGAILANDMNDPAYKARKGSGAFLQSESPDYVLIEFWEGNYQPFVDYLNQQAGELK